MTLKNRVISCPLFRTDFSSTLKISLKKRKMAKKSGQMAKNILSLARQKPSVFKGLRALWPIGQLFFTLL